MKQFRFYGLACSLLLLITGCSEPQGDDYFPLAKGYRWQYRITTQTRLGSEQHEYQVENLGQRTFDDEVHYLRRADVGVDYFFQRDQHGVFRTGKRTLVETTPRWDSERRDVLRLPITLDQQWTQQTHPFVLQRITPFQERFTRSMPLTMQYSVVATDARVSVPAGVFTDCVQVKGEALAYVLADPATGVSEAPITTYEWYAPGVGLVKWQRLEQLDTPHVIGGEIVMELLTFDD